MHVKQLLRLGRGKKERGKVAKKERGNERESGLLSLTAKAKTKKHVCIYRLRREGEKEQEKVKCWFSAFLMAWDRRMWNKGNIFMLAFSCI